MFHLEAPSIQPHCLKAPSSQNGQRSACMISVEGSVILQSYSSDLSPTQHKREEIQLNSLAETDIS